MVLGVFTNLCNCQTTHCRCDVQRGIAWQLSSNNVLHPTGAASRIFRGAKVTVCISPCYDSGYVEMAPT